MQAPGAGALRCQPASIGPSSLALQQRLQACNEAMWPRCRHSPIHFGLGSQEQHQWRQQRAAGLRCRAQQQSDESLTSCEERQALEPDEVLTPQQAATQEPALPAAQSMPRNAVRWQLASRAVGGPAGNVTPLLGLGGMAVVGAMGSGLDISGPASTVGALSVLAAIVAIHECGHFVAARLQNIHVTKFSIGFGPALLKWQGPEVEYAFRAIPLGGFVGFPDDDPDLKDKFPPDDPNLLKNRPIKDRALVISAGIIANCIFAMSILLTQVSTIGVIETSFLPGVRIPEVVQGSVADRAGFKPGDTVTQVQGQEIRASATAVNDIVNAIKDRPKKGMSFLVERAGQAIEIPVTVAEAPDGTGRIGVQLAVNAKVAKVKPDGPLAAVQLAAREFGKLTTTVVTGLTQIFTNFSKTAESVSGPVAIVAVGAEVARADISGLFQFAAIVNINLAVVNALPLPALDGGYMALLLAEALRGKKLDETVEKSIMASGLLLLMAVGVVLVVRDTINLGGGARM